MIDDLKIDGIPFDEYFENHFDLFDRFGIERGNWKELALSMESRFVTPIDEDYIDGIRSGVGDPGRSTRWDLGELVCLMKTADKIKSEAEAGARHPSLKHYKNIALLIATDPAYKRWATPDDTIPRKWAKTLQNKLAEARTKHHAFMTTVGRKPETDASRG